MLLLRVLSPFAFSSPFLQDSRIARPAALDPIQNLKVQFDENESRGGRGRTSSLASTGRTED